jgi:hypothetical protein
MYEAVLIMAYEIMAEFDKETLPEDPLTINQEFTIGYLNPEMATAYQNLVDSGIISAAAAFRELKRKGFLNDEMDWVEVSAEMLKEQQSSSLMPDNFGTGE